MKGRRVLFLILFLGLAAWSAAQCEAEERPTSLTVEGLGVVYFADFETNTATGTARLYGGVCVQGEDWTLRTEAAVVSGLRDQENLRAELGAAILEYRGWQVAADEVLAEGSLVTLTGVRFNAGNVAGTAGRLVVIADGSAAATAWQVSVRGPNLSVDAASGRIDGEVATLVDVRLSTCNCPGEPFYSLAGTGGVLRLDEPSLELAGGVLDVAGVRVPLEDGVVLSERSLSNLALPLSVEYRPPPGSGLGLVIRPLELAPGLTAELGLLGLSGDAPLRGLFLTRYGDDRAQFTVGFGRGGPTSEFRYRQATGPGTVEFAVRNSHEARFDYLHEGSIRYLTDPLLVPLGREGRLELSARALAAASTQTVSDEAVTSPRLGTRLEAVATLAPPRAGTFTVAGIVDLTTYPALAANQYGLTLSGGWRGSLGPVAAHVALDRTWTNSGSPFTERLDRILPRSHLVAGAALRGQVNADVGVAFSVDFDYDLLRLGVAGHQGLDRLGVAGLVDVDLDSGWTVEFAASLELAGALDPDPSGRRTGHVGARLTIGRGELEAGIAAVYGLRPEARGLTTLELSGAVPVTFENATVTPFLAIDFAPLVTGGGGPLVSGHGLALTWNSCCGTIHLAYRQRDGEFDTELGLEIVN